MLPLVYNELRRLAAQKMAQEVPGQTLQATALVHEAYIRLVDMEKVQHWDSRGHFFAAAAEAMRRILVENARRKQSVKHGSEHRRVKLDDAVCGVELPADSLPALDDALTKLAEKELHLFCCFRLIPRLVFAYGVVRLLLRRQKGVRYLCEQGSDDE